MRANVITADIRDIPKLLDVLQQYRFHSKKSWGEILEHEAEQWRWELWGGETKKGTTAKVGFKQISPSPTKIYRDAEARGFRINRRPNAITKAFDGVSWAADAAADTMLGTDKSDLFRVEVNENGVFIKPVRFSNRKSEKFLTGGRTGRKFADGAKRAKDTSAEKVRETREMDPSIKRLNKRALSVAIELSLRSRAAKGGTMALQWLGSNYKKRKSSTIKTGPTVIRSAKGIPLGIIGSSSHGDATQITMSALVHGTARQAARHGIIPKVEAARVADRMKYINRKLAEAKAKALERSMAA